MKAIRDTALLFERTLTLNLRNPAWVVIGVIQPLFYLVLFGPLLEPLAGAPGFTEGSVYNVFVPGLLIQLALFNTAFVGFGLIAELRTGVVERLRVTPVSRLALLLGRALCDVTTLIVQSLLLVVCAIPFGLNLNALGLVVVVGLLVLLGLLMATTSYGLALWLRDENAFAPLLTTVTVPLLLLSGVLLPLSLAPGWLRLLAALNPLSYAVDAARALFNAQLANPSVPLALTILGVLTVAAVWLTSRAFGRAIA